MSVETGQSQADPFAIGGRTQAVAASIGVALARPGHERPEDALRDADAALYRAKAAGRGGFALHEG